MEGDTRGRGRPRLEHYMTPMWKEIMLDAGLEGKHTTDVLIQLGISWNGHYALLERNKDYSQTYSEFLKLAENYWYNMALDAMRENGGVRFNTKLWETVMKNRFKDNWTTERKIDLVSNGQTIKSDNKIQIEIIKTALDESKDEE